MLELVLRCEPLLRHRAGAGGAGRRPHREKGLEWKAAGAFEGLKRGPRAGVEEPREGLSPQNNGKLHTWGAGCSGLVLDKTPLMRGDQSGGGGRIVGWGG